MAVLAVTSDASAPALAVKSPVAGSSTPVPTAPLMTMSRMSKPDSFVTLMTIRDILCLKVICVDDSVGLTPVFTATIRSEAV